jgi:hypothetical protein
MNALPCIVSRDLVSYQRKVDREADYQARVEAKAVELRAAYRQDAEILWESMGNVTARKDAKDVPAIIKVLRDGGTLHELAAAMHGLRELALAESDDTANINAEAAVQKEDERAERHSALRAFRQEDEL